MIIKVSAKRGSDMPGLVRYLYGPGKNGEHRDQHMVAGYGALPHVYAGALNPETASDLGRMVEESWRRNTMEQLALAGHAARGISSVTRRGMVGLDEAASAPHVYQMVVSLSPDEGTYTDEQWDTVAREVVQGMGFSTGPDDLHGNSWIAVRHGLSAEGNDHIHIAVNLVRQDGVPRNPHRDFKTAQDVRRDLEQRLDFVTPLRDRGYDRSGKHNLPQYSHVEHAIAADRESAKGQPVVPDRVQLQRLVRSAAETSSTEAEFLNTLMQNGVEIEHRRFNRELNDPVKAYAVRLTGVEKPQWCYASQLAPDLTLGKLRPGWAANETPESLAHADGLWRENIAPSSAADVDEAAAPLQEAAEHLREWNTELRTLDPQDTNAWNEQLLAASGIVSSMSLPPIFEADPRDQRTALSQDADVVDQAPSLDPDPVHIEYVLGRAGDQLTQVADPLGRQMQQAAPATRSGPSRPELAARQIVLAMRASSPDSHRGWLAVMQQLGRTVDAINDAQRARGELVAAQRVSSAMATALTEATRRLEQLPPQKAKPGVRDISNLSPEARKALSGLRAANRSEQLNIQPGSESRFDRPQRPGHGVPPNRQDKDHGKGR